jgi:hypothetical protein
MSAKGTGNPSWRPMLAARPVRNRAASVSERGGGEVTVAVRVRRPAWLVPPLSWIVPLRPTRTVHLDRLGTEVWRLCDGERTVEQVVDAFAARHGLSFHEARVAVTSYLGGLVQRGALAVVTQEENDCETPG